MISLFDVLIIWRI